MTAYYNEFDPFAAQWLRNLIDANLIAPGVLDDRSITDVTASDLRGFTQCHFFAGIGGWSLALRLAGVPDTFNCWTGSPPCQPFSVAGKQLGQLDERHLAPTFMRLVSQCRPPVLFGEQVAAAIGKHWLDDLFAELEAEGYACGAAVLPAASVGAPHKRDRLFFGAALLEHASGFGWESWRNGDNAGDDGQQLATIGKNRRMAYYRLQQRQVANARCGTGRPLSGERQQASVQIAGCSGNSCMADTNDARPQGRGGMPECANQQPAGAAGLASSMADPRHSAEQPSEPRSVERRLPQGIGEDAAVRANPHNGFWSDADWIGCRDGKFRPIEPGTFPLANGIPARVGRLRGYGNAIVPQVAKEFVLAFLDAVSDPVEVQA